MKILKPIVGQHDGSSFREMLDIWKEKGICEVADGIRPDPFYMEETQLLEARPWIDSVGNIMLYDQPILDKIHDGLNWKLALFANEVPPHPENQKIFKYWDNKGYCATWTFWPNHPKAHEQVRSEGIPGYDERPNLSCFLGSLTTHHRGNFNEWKRYIQNFWMGGGNDRLLTQVEYLKFLKSNKFGLCLRGVGPKCLRDVELIGLGTVPIFTTGVSTDYYNPLIKDKHFLYAEYPSEIPILIENCPKEKWEELSRNCIEWFNENGSPEGVFKVTKKIIEDFNIYINELH